MTRTHDVHLSCASTHHLSSAAHNCEDERTKYDYTATRKCTGDTHRVLTRARRGNQTWQGTGRGTSGDPLGSPEAENLRKATFSMIRTVTDFID